MLYWPVPICVCGSKGARAPGPLPRGRTYSEPIFCISQNYFIELKPTSDSRPMRYAHGLRQHSSDDAKTIDEDQLRLESDDDAVLLATIHKSKGLEYPIVFCPFLWKAGGPKNRSEILFHDPATDYRLTLDLRNQRPLLDDNNRLAGEECMAESLRVLYVALTRAQNRCYVYAGDISDFGASPLAHVLGVLDHAPALPALEALAQKAGGAIAVTVIDPAADQRVVIKPSLTETD